MVMSVYGNGGFGFERAGGIDSRERKAERREEAMVDGFGGSIRAMRFASDPATRRSRGRKRRREEERDEPELSRFQHVWVGGMPNVMLVSSCLN